jgi:xanthine dehydrogenase YagS FAD-binding subunit
VRAFQLHEPQSLGEAVDLLAMYGTRSRPLAGGTDLVAGVMRDQLIGKGMPYPSHLVDLTKVPEMGGIRVGPEGAVIGATTTLAEIAESDDLGRSWPMLVATASEVASPEIRAIGTIGGNLHQRPRCWFFRNKDFDCIKKGGDICFAVKGDNRYNAILGGHLCFIVHPSDLASTLVALGAQARVVSSDGERTISFDEYFIGPQEDLLRETVLRPDELLADVMIPAPMPGTYQAWEKINEKDAPTWDFALASVAAVMTVVDGVWHGGRIVLGGVAPVPFRATVVEDAFAGHEIRSALPAAIAAIRGIARPMSDNAYKVDLVEYLLERVVAAALARGPIPAPTAAAVPAR